MSRRSSPAALNQLLKNDESWWDTLVSAFAELIGSAILVFIGCMGCVGSLTSSPPHLQIALTFAFAVGTIVHIIGHISNGHVTPVVTICFLILGLTSITTTAIYIFAQLLGAIIGYGLLRVVTPAELLHSGNSSTIDSFCVTTVNEKISSVQGLLVEIVATGILILFVCSVVDPRNTKSSVAVPIKFGLLIGMLAMATGPYTGCSLNPARSFAPALWNNDWRDQWVYWLGPILGSILVSLTYKFIFWPKKWRNKAIAEAAELNTLDAEKP